jgi:hypothetical protein
VATDRGERRRKRERRMWNWQAKGCYIYVAVWRKERHRLAVRKYKLATWQQ